MPPAPRFLRQAMVNTHEMRDHFEDCCQRKPRKTPRFTIREISYLNGCGVLSKPRSLRRRQMLTEHPRLPSWNGIE